MIKEFQSKFVAVVDGDTVIVDIDLGFNIWRKNCRIRLASIDTPELNTSEGKAAARWLWDHLGKIEWLTIVLHGTGEDKYGRVLGDIIVNTVNIGNLMLTLGIAKPYTGKGEKPWPEKNPVVTPMGLGSENQEKSGS